MYNFLDRSVYQKVRILIHLHSINHFCSISDMAKSLNVSDRTILKFIDELKHDLKEIEPEAEIIERGHKNFYLNTKDNFSIKSVERWYLEQSLTYKACDQIFYNTFGDIHAFAKKNYTSYASMYRRINKIKPLLDQFKLQYTTQHLAAFNGTEKQFRYFYYLFYWNSCWGEIWPFSSVIREQMLELLKEEKESISEHMLYWLAISITRAKLGYVIEEDPTYESFTKHHHLFKSFSRLAKPLFKELTALTEDQITLEIMFSFTVISCFEFYDKKDPQISLIMNFAQHHNQDLFVQTTIHWLKTFMEFFSIEIDAAEYSALFANLLYLHYYTQTFEGPTFLFKEDPYKIAFEQNSPHQVELMNRFYDQLSKKKALSKIFKHRERLLGRYHGLLKRTINFNVDTRPIKVKIFSILEGDPSEYIINQIKGISSHIHLCKDSEHPDLIITDRLYMNIERYDAKIFVWSSVPKRIDFERLSACIERMRLIKLP
ncbi:helix-turn-helix domain-containing protein [Peribacillus butanolivorans]|uniref:helix-turn-helix domain-containing protein n=1 Tax=Peribacillus butanolivorans TaxID=421767 RepID=UPI0036CD2056